MKYGDHPMKKTFDCVEMKRHRASQLSSLLAEMSREEQLVFWQQRTIALRKLQASFQYPTKEDVVTYNAGSKEYDKRTDTLS